MAHFPGPHSWTVRGVFRTLATVVFTLCFGTFCEENVRHFVEERHWNEFLSNGLQSMPDLGPITQSHWFWFVFGASTGIVSALWMAMFFSDSSNLSGRGSATTLVSYAHGLALV
jgi:hypothetical protein